MATKTDAKGVEARYSYDDYRRLIQVSYYVSGQEDVPARVTMTYDTNPLDGIVFAASWGRLTTRQYTIQRDWLCRHVQLYGGRPGVWRGNGCG